jgi:hypothetical protein
VRQPLTLGFDPVKARLFFCLRRLQGGLEHVYRRSWRSFAA